MDAFEGRVARGRLPLLVRTCNETVSVARGSRPCDETASHRRCAMIQSLSLFSLRICNDTVPLHLSLSVAMQRYSFSRHILKVF